MAKLPEMFNCASVEPAGVSANQLPLSGPVGHPVIITSSELKENKNHDGGFLELNVRVIEGEFVGAEGPYRLNLFNKNEKTVEIAYKQLSALGYVCGQLNIADSAQLHNIPFKCIVGNQKLTAEQAAKQAAGETVVPFTEIKGVLHMDGSAPGKSAGAASAPAQAPTPPATFTPPPVAAVAQPAAPEPAAWTPGPAVPVQQAAPASAAPASAAPASAAPAWAANPVAAAGAAPPWGAK
jgi:hypothetical protein